METYKVSSIKEMEQFKDEYGILKETGIEKEEIRTLTAQ